MSQTESYYVVRSTKEKDEEFAGIEAPSLSKASSAFLSWRSENYDKVDDDDVFYIFSTKHPLQFDENNRLIEPKGEVRTIIRL